VENSTAQLIFTNSGGTLDTVTADNNLNVWSNTNNANVHIYNTLTLDNAVLEIGGSSTSYYGYVYLGTPGIAAANIQVANGATGEIRFGASTGNDLIDDSNLTTSSGDATLISSAAAPLTLDGANGTIYQEYQTANTFTNQGTINENGGGTLNLDNSWINAGTIEATNGTIAIASFTNNGSILANGSGSTLTLGTSTNSWNNAGTIISSNSATVNLGGVFMPTGLGVFNRAGGTVNLIGTLNLNNQVLNLTAALGSWVLKGALIENGTITTSGGAELIAGSSSNTLNSVTLNGTLDISQVSNAQATVEGGMLLNGTILIGNSSGSTYGALYFGTYNAAAGSLTGTGTVTMGASINNTFDDYSNLSGQQTLIVGPNITINASNGTVGGAFAGDVLVEEGTLNVFGQGNLSIEHPLVLGQSGANTGVLNVSPSATVNFYTSGITGASTNFAASDAAGLIVFNGGSAGSPQYLEAMSQDLGDVSSGFNNNFDYGTITVTQAGYVRLEDLSNNTGGTSAEAVYANALLVNTGSTLDLNGLNLYTRASQVNGTVINGTITQLPNAGALTMNTPTPGKLSTAGELDQWSFFEHGGQQISVVVNPGNTSSSPAPISPSLGYAKVELLDANNDVLGSSSGGFDQLVTINDVTLPADGTYKIEINAPSGHTSSTGNYVVGAYDVTPNIHSLTLNENQVGNIGTAFGIDQWNFSGGAGQQIQFNLLNETTSGLEYTLTGPNGYSAFNNAAGSSGLIDLPSSGNYTLSVSGLNGQIGQYAFNITQTSQAALTLGNLYNGTFQASGQAQLFTVQVTVSQPLSITLNDLAATDHTELYARLGAAPTLQTFDAGDSSSGSSHTLLVPDATIGTWYILVYGEAITSAPQPFTLRATSGEVVITKSEPASSAANLATTLTINGAGFNGGSRVTLVSDLAGMTISASTSSLDLPTQITATFNAGTIPAGTYSVVVTQADNTSDTLPDALTVAAGGQATLTTSIVLPNPIGYHISSVLYVNYANTGTVAMPAPLLIFTAYMDGKQGALMTLNAALQTAGFWTTSTPAGFSQTVEILASGATPGVLEPGESEQVPVYYDGWLNNQWDFNRPPITFSISSIQADNTQTINWSSQEAALQPTGISTTAWNTIYNNLESVVGTTGGSYVQMLDSNAAYLGRLGENVDDVSSLWSFAVEQSNANISPVGQMLTSATDDTLAMPGSLTFAFDREFATSISGRDTVGPFGYGWSTSWDTSLSVGSDGTVTLMGQEGSQRIYEPDSRTTGAYFSSPGDYSTLTAVSGGYKLTETDGSLTFYNSNGTLGYIEDSNGNKITAGYNSNNQLATLTSSASGTMTIAYNPAGLISSITDSDGRVTTYTYEGSNQHLLSVTGYGGQTTSYAYNSDNSLASITYPGDTHQYYTYDSEGRLASDFVDGNQEKVSYAYNEGEVTATDALGDATSRYFDANGLLVKSVDALGNATFATYDANFDLIKLTDANGQTERFTYDANGNLTNSTDELGNTTTYTYSGTLNRLSSSTDANGNTTAYAYNSNGDLTSITYANGSTDSTTYDADGDAISFTNPSGQVTTYTYNSAGEITKETFADGTSTTLTYDSRGRLATAVDASGTITFTYNTADQLTEVAYPNGQSLTFTYNAAGERTQMVDNTGYTINYSYDSAGRLSELTDGSDNPIVTYTYDAAGRLSKKTNGNGTYTTYTYDADGNVIDLINYSASNGVQSSFAYTYDAVNERTSETTTAGTWVYTYDAAGALTHAVYTLTGQDAASQDLAYSYDANGNLTQTVINGVTTAYVVNKVNEYTSVGGVAYTYDANGDLTSDGTNTYTYNPLGQLASVSNLSGTTSYTYDALGNMNSTTAGGVTTNYLVDPTGEGNVVAQFNGSTLVSHSIYGLGLAAQVTANSNVYYYGFDATGSTAQLTNGAGSVVDNYSYLPFGSLLSSSVTVANSFKFTGQVGDLTDSTGLVSMRAREYSPTLGRFLTTDPAGAGNNPYEYALNNPVSYIDPAGLLPNGAALYKIHLFANLSALLKSIIKIIPSHPVHGGVVSIVGAVGKSTSTSPNPSSNNSPYNNPNDNDPDDNDNSDDDNSDDDDNNLDNTDNNNDNNNDDDNNNNDNNDDNPDNNDNNNNDNNPDDPDDPGPDPDPGPGDPGPGGSSGSVTSHDPNLKTGPAGYGTENFVQDTGSSAFPYTIEFENAGPGSKDANGNSLPESDWATAPAQQVTVTDQLSSDLDWSTFQLTGISFGDIHLTIPADSQQYQTEVSMTYLGVTFEVEVQAGIHTDTGVVYADFYSIDPNTDLPPSNPLIGFLPPEPIDPNDPSGDGTGAGIGMVSYTVDPNQDLASGTQINNVGTITFDTNPSLTTDQVNDEDPSQGIDTSKEATVTIDNTPPTSTVTALPANDPATTFPVSWSGSDGSGSGIASYTIYASVNGGAFSPWLTDTTQTTADYTGTIGSSYAFYSVATDNVGNVEAQHASADTQTTLIANTMTPVVSAGGNQTIAGLTLSRSGSFADTDSGDSWTSTVDYGDGTGAQTLTLNSDKTFTLSHTYALDGTYNVAVNVIDAANHDGSAQFTVIMDSTPPAATLGNVSTATAGASSVTFSVTYTDANGVDNTTLGGGAITVTLPNGNSVTANLQSQSGSGSSVTATYSMSASSGTFSANDNGTYTIKLAAGSVKDVPGNAVAAETLGTFSIALSGGNGGSTNDTTPPTATVASVGTPTIDTTTLSFVVDFSDDVSLNTNSIATGDIIVTGPGNFSQVATLVSGPSSSSATAATATFQITAPGGFFTDADNGNYSIALDAGTLLDTAGNVAAAATIGSFAANIAAPASLPDLTGTISSIPTTVLPLSKKNVVVIDVSNSGAKPIKGNVPFTLYAYTGTFNASSAIPLSSGILKVNLKNGFSKAFSESFVAPTSISTGDYHIAAVLDPHDTISEEYKSNNTILSGGTSHFEAPTVDVGITFTPPGAISTTKKSKVSVNITNHGNVTASGTGTIQLYASTDQSDLQTLLGTLPGKFSLKAGASKKYSVTVANDASLKGEQEYLIAVVSYSGSPADDNAANNTVFSSSQVSFT
jgi:RHS repeat-associated protein